MISEPGREECLTGFSPASFFRRLIVPAFISFLVFLPLKAAAPSGYPLSLALTLSGPEGVYQIYFDRGRGYNRADSLFADYPGGEGEIHVQIPAGPISGIRIDPGNKISTVSVSGLCLRRSAPPDTALCWSGAGLAQEFRPRQDIAEFKNDGGNLTIKTYGRHPYFESNPETSLKLADFSAGSMLTAAIFAGLAGVLAFFLLPVIGAGIEQIATGPRRIGVFLAIFACAVFVLNAGSTISRIVPPFQGPDENDHLGKLAAIEQNSECGWARFDFAYLLTVLTPIIRHQELKISAEQIPNIFDTEPSDGAAPNQPIGLGACAYNRLYLLPVIMINKLTGRSISKLSPAAYIQDARSGVTIAAVCFWVLTGIVIAYGRPLFKPSADFSAALRSGAALGALYICLLPQTIFLDSVLNQDYLLLAAGSFAAISLFFRIRYLSDLLFFISLIAGFSKVFYLIPFGVIAIVHYFLAVLQQDSKFAGKIRSFACRHRATLIAVSIAAPVIGFLIVYLFSDWYCRDSWCYNLDHASFFSNPSGFAADIGLLWWKFHTLGLPADFNFDSAFAAFGWLDSYLHTGFADIYTAPITAALTAGIMLLPPALWNGTAPERRSSLYLLVIALGVFVVSFFTLYLIAVLMQGWCGAGSEFGCGYQKRYELPLYGLYPVLFFSLAVFALGRAGSGGKSGRPLQIQITGVLAAAQIVAAVICYHGQVEALTVRYFYQAADLNLYQQNLDKLNSFGGN